MRFGELIFENTGCVVKLVENGCLISKERGLLFRAEHGNKMSGSCHNIQDRFSTSLKLLLTQEKLLITGCNRDYSAVLLLPPPPLLSGCNLVPYTTAFRDQ